ncbi:hypothetical protein [Bradyrhizobium brasilense]|uniref:hypothetical protein n=1 Tax=Bradyrhizobium brasilense TaxID=1419277 RepID=UPI001E3688C7|nr:hypothetical protein [Bradyrhizobium brasilense]MCC8976422.1 hypothetical protein [Bradyrhizobium brasilense]
MAKKTTEELLAATRGAAAAFIEDMPHIREVVRRQNIDKGELRRLSNVLRRLLVDNGGDLRDVAAPRIGRFSLLSFDNNPVFKAEQKGPAFPFFQSGGASVFGVFFRAAIVDTPGREYPVIGFNPEQMVALALDNFLSQRVLCLKGKWAARRDVIKYIANIASGVHSGTPKDPEHILLNRIRHAAAYSVIPVPSEYGAPAGATMPSYAFNVDVLTDIEKELTYSATAVDPVLIEMLAVAHLLTISPDIEKLEGHIRTELGV